MDGEIFSLRRMRKEEEVQEKRRAELFFFGDEKKFLVFRFCMSGVYVRQPTNEWFEMEDLRVTQVLPQFVALSGKGKEDFSLSQRPPNE